MRAFYSLVKVSPNPAAGDSLTIGIIVADKSGVSIKFSANKLSFARNLLNKNFVLVDFIVKQLTLKVDETNDIITKNKTLLLRKQSFIPSGIF